MKKFLRNNDKTRITYTVGKLGGKFQIKDLIKNQHEHNSIYYNKCLNQIVMRIV